MEQKQNLPIGYLAQRTGLAVSAIRFYEEKGLITPGRNSGGQRRYCRADIRRLSFVLIAQKMGFALSQIQDMFQGLPMNRTPTKSDWARISKSFRRDIDERIQSLERLRDKLDGCIGCGCLSLKSCALYNPQDLASQQGDGPRYLIGDSPP